MNKNLLAFFSIAFIGLNLFASQFNASEIENENINYNNEQIFENDNPKKGITATIEGKSAKTLFEELKDLRSPQCEGKICELQIASISCQSIPYVFTSVDICTIFPSQDSVESRQLMYGKASKIYKAIRQGENPFCSPLIPMCVVMIENLVCKKDSKGFLSNKYTCSFLIP